MNLDGWALFGAVASAHALGVMSPGPDFAVVTRQSLALGRAAGVWTAAGIGSGILFHVAYGLFGLRWLTQQFPWSLNAIAIAGATFLVWMGLQALRAQPQAIQDDSTQPAQRGNGWRNYGIGLATNLLNPKIAVFYLSVFPQFVRPGHGSVFAHSVVLGCTQIAVSLAVGRLLPELLDADQGVYRTLGVGYGALGVFLIGYGVRLVRMQAQAQSDLARLERSIGVDFGDQAFHVHLGAAGVVARFIHQGAVELDADRRLRPDDLAIADLAAARGRRGGRRSRSPASCSARPTPAPRPRSPPRPASCTTTAPSTWPCACTTRRPTRCRCRWAAATWPASRRSGRT